MGCDIHAMIERRHAKLPWWVNAGDPDIGRNYQLFTVLAGVRAESEEHRALAIAEPRGIPDDASEEMSGWHEAWELVDAHSASHVTLAEMRAYDVERTYHSSHLILERDAEGAIVATCGFTNGPHLGEVGETAAFGPWGADAWNDLITRMDAVKLPGQTDEEVRLVFFFDN